MAPPQEPHDANINKIGIFQRSKSMKTNFLVIDLGLCEGKEIQGYINIFESLGIPNSRYRIIGFEAFKAFADYCQRKYSRNPSVSIQNLAVTDRSEAIRLYLNCGGGPGNSIYADKNNVDENNWVDIHAISIVDFLREAGLFDDPTTFRIIKMNVEGCEYRIIRDFIRKGYYDIFDLWIGAEPGIDLLKIKSMRAYHNRLLRLMNTFGIKQHFYCLDDRFAHLSIDLEHHIRNALQIP